MLPILHRTTTWDSPFKEWSIDFDFVVGMWGRASTEPVLSSTPASWWWKRRPRPYMPNVVDNTRLSDVLTFRVTLSVVAEVTDRIFYIKSHLRTLS